MWQWAKIQAVLPSSGRGEGEGRGVGAATAGARTGGGTLTAEVRPALDKALDRLLARLERGSARVWRRVQGIARSAPHYHTTNYAMGVYGEGSERPGGRDPFSKKQCASFASGGGAFQPRRLLCQAVRLAKRWQPTAMRFAIPTAQMGSSGEGEAPRAGENSSRTSRSRPWKPLSRTRNCLTRRSRTSRSSVSNGPSNCFRRS